MDDALYHEMFQLEERYWWFVAKHNILMNLINRFLKPSSQYVPRVCDIGCGCGALLKRLTDKYQAIGIDASPLARAFCQQRGLEVQEGELPDAIPLESNSLDAVVLSDVLEHIEDDRAAVAAVTRMLRPGGLLLCTVPAHQWLWSKRDEFHHHYRRYGYWQYKRLFQSLSLTTEILSFYNVATFPAMIIMRLATKFFGEKHAGPDIPVVSVPINTLLTCIFEAEKIFLPIMTFPVGASLISVHRQNC
ncbi:MAG: class I SAM-dependent methyltransferase [Planctomycetota bacterium]|nr:MAG: class I SAM-dependent methyltransferase [Planctomycetota bacterium]